LTIDRSTERDDIMRTLSKELYISMTVEGFPEFDASSNQAKDSEVILE